MRAPNFRNLSFGVHIAPKETLRREHCVEERISAHFSAMGKNTNSLPQHRENSIVTERIHYFEAACALADHELQ